MLYNISILKPPKTVILNILSYELKFDIILY